MLIARQRAQAVDGGLRAFLFRDAEQLLFERVRVFVEERLPRQACHSDQVFRRDKAADRVLQGALARAASFSAAVIGAASAPVVVFFISSLAPSNISMSESRSALTSRSSTRQSLAAVPANCARERA